MGRTVVQGAGVLTMNLTFLKKSRKTPQVGDIFVMQPPDGAYLFGRVIDTDANPLGIGGAILIYIYQARSKTKEDIPRLSPSDLLVPPMMTNKQPWTRGYFETLTTRPLSTGDKLQQHCFVRSWTSPKQYFDERGKPVPGPVEPVGDWGLHGYRTIDDAVSKVLGIPLAPEDNGGGPNQTS